MTQEVEMKRCAHCGQWVPAEAQMCAACGTSDVDGERARAAVGPRRPAAPALRPSSWNATTALLVANVLYLLWSVRVQFSFTPDVGVFETLIRMDGLSDALPRAGWYSHARVAEQGEWWRLVTATFLHAGIFHIGMNMYVLTQVGRVLEHLLGTARFLTIYLVSGIGSTAAISLWYVHILGADRVPPMVGASGAVFGALGCLAAFALRMPQARGLGMRLVRDIVLMLLIGLIVPMVSNVGHVGGLLPGLVFGALVGERFSDRLRPGGGALWIVAALIVTTVTLFALACGVEFSLEHLGDHR